MLGTNQRLDKLAAMRSNFVSCGMLPAGHIPGRGLLIIQNSGQLAPNERDGDDNDDNDDNDGPVEGDNILGHVGLARSPSMLKSMTDHHAHSDH